jgi:hypothetical protein
VPENEPGKGDEEKRKKLESRQEWSLPYTPDSESSYK